MGILGAVRQALGFLKTLRRPAIPLALAHERYDPMVVALADALEVEFGVRWHTEREAEFDTSGRHWDYTTRTFIADRPLHKFSDWSDRYDRVVRTVADVRDDGPFGDPVIAHAGDHVTGGQASDGEGLSAKWGESFRSLDDMGPMRNTRDRVGGDIELDIDQGQTRLRITAAITPRCDVTPADGGRLPPRPDPADDRRADGSLSAT